MFRKSLFTIVSAIAGVLLVQTAVYAQTAPVNGTVMLEKADGTKEPVAGALVEVYRTDIKAGAPSAKTNKKGEFNFAGLPYGEFAFAISAPNCSPLIFPNVRAGQERLVITVRPGDGKKLTETEVRKGVAGAGTGSSDTGGKEDQDQKAAQAELEKKNAEIMAKNARLKESDDIARKSVEEGNAAYNAGNYDLALIKYNEGVAAVPDFVGSTPILLFGKMSALKMKGLKLHQEGSATADPAIRKPKYQEANALYDQSLDAFNGAMDVIKKAEQSTDPAEQKRRDNQKLSLYTTAIEVHRLKGETRDASKTADAATVINEYIVLESDPAKKLKAHMTLGDIMRRTGDLEKAVEAYRLVLAASPENADATGKLGLSLFGLGAASDPEDKAKEQEGLNYMQKYTEMAPVAATDSEADKELKTSIKNTVEYLKAEKMTPQKPPSKKKN